MNIGQQILESLERKSAQDDFPDFLYEPVAQVARRADEFADRQEILETLLMQVEEFDFYAESGCCKTAFDAEDIKVSLRRLQS